MLRVKGTYDGGKIVLVAPLPVPAQTLVDVLVPESAVDAERLYWQCLAQEGLVLERPAQPAPGEDFAPVVVRGEPVSATVIAERR
ncbi:MAG: hypothetical protein ACYC5O_15010 [Anaerolineae bacterium]